MSSLSTEPRLVIVIKIPHEQFIIILLVVMGKMEEKVYVPGPLEKTVHPKQLCFLTKGQNDRGGQGRAGTRSCLGPGFGRVCQQLIRVSGDP